VLPALLIGLVLAYATILRLDALFRSYGPYDHPGWFVSVQEAVATTAAVAVPSSWEWPRREAQHDIGDPINYLAFARDMRSFYQAHVREPVFLAATRAWLGLTGGLDVSVSLSSVSFSVLLILATYLLGASIASKPVGLAAAAALAVEHQVIALSIGGWRDEASAFFCVLCAWALVRLRTNPRMVNAVIAGAVAAGACLTRITSIVFVVPALVYVWGTGGRAGLAQRSRLVGVAALVLLALTAPYLINCARTFGDPLYSINYHVRFYVARERGVAPLEDEAAAALPSASGYALSKFRERPLEAFDTAVQGLTSFPFTNKWRGFDVWNARVGPGLAVLALLGLWGWLLDANGRLLLIILVASLAPFMMTWPVRGGAEWRFTLHAYPFYLLAACGFVRQIVVFSRRLFATGFRKTIADLDRGRIVRRAAVLLLPVVAAPVLAFGVPYLIAHGSLERGEGAYVIAGPRDRLFFTDGWSAPVTEGNVVARFATQRVATLSLPLSRRRPYSIILRMDPLHYEGAAEQRVRVSLDGAALDTVTLLWDPNRVGSYTIDVPAGAVNAGRVRLDLVADRLDVVSRAGSRFPELRRDQAVAFRLWYVGVVPK
jgi:4-amino-4-deoxy-L-arabinose transferase-like glycosyltransferase